MGRRLEEGRMGDGGRISREVSRFPLGHVLTSCVAMA